ncbi:porin [Hydrogenophaga sp. ANAO-22]|uniref:porin n=1 Tax=Hydrogenophaga sp. ANAO-22 TaxID=3166645 RepID=UPI0036D40266
MKNKSIRHALGGTALAALAFGAGAQDVQIYGIADVYVGSVRGSSTKTVVDDGGNAASRLGFRGREDLGGGHAAYFALEMGMLVDVGTTAVSSGFGRQAFVGYRAPWGSLEAGRQYTPLFFNLLATVPFGMNVNWAPVQMSTSMDGQPAAVRALGFPLRQSNLLRYRYGGGPNAKGLNVDVVAAPGEDATNSGDMVGFGASYRGDHFFIGYAGQRIDSGTAAVTKFRNEIQGVNGSYTLGAWTISGAHLVSDSSLPGGRRAAHTVLGLAHDAGPHRWMLEANRRDLKGSPNDALAIALGYDHRLSKRTALYGRLLHLSNRGTASNALAQAVVNAGSGDDVRAVALGVRHNF